eukprot:s439_g13.t1
MEQSSFQETVAFNELIAVPSSRDQCPEYYRRELNSCLSCRRGKALSQNWRKSVIYSTFLQLHFDHIDPRKPTILKHAAEPCFASLCDPLFQMKL